MSFKKKKSHTHTQKYEYLVQVLNTTWMLKNKQTNKQKALKLKTESHYFCVIGIKNIIKS